MKTVCKKLLSLMLVAVLLVSAVPMMASAKTDVPVNVYIDGVLAPNAQKTLELDSTALLNASLAATLLEGDKEFQKWENPSNADVTGQTLNEADLVSWNGTFYLNLYVTRTTSSSNQGGSNTGNQGGSTGNNPSGGGSTPIATNYTITFDINGNVTQQVYQQNALIAFPTASDTATTYFTGWKDSNGNPVTPGSAVCTGNMKYTAAYANKTAYTFISANNTTSTVYYKPNETVTCPTAQKVDGKAVSGWYTASTGGAKIAEDGGTFTAGSTNATYYAQYYDVAKYPYDVLLNIYTNGKVDAPTKKLININSLAQDGVVSLSEVESVVRSYYTVASGYNSIEFDGLYMAKGQWLDNFVINKKENSISVEVARQSGDVTINVMARNVTAKSSSNADSTNPKTGDSIYTAVAVMGLSVTALAAVYYINKKRMAY